MDKKPRLGSDPLGWIRDAQERTLILLTMLFFIGIIFFLFANSYRASIKEEYELQERCGNRAEERYRKEYGNETPMSNYTNHYNRKLNRCFILVTQIIQSDTYKTLVDINENRPHGFFSKIVSLRTPTSWCEVLGKPCHSESEWDSLVRPFMEE
jgi:hypothetical protein